MSIVIVGAGTIGTHLASVLAKEGKSIILIDEDGSKLERFARSADVATICACGTNWQILEEIVEQNPLLFCALTSRDETNLSACAIAKHLGFPTTLARISKPFFLDHSKVDFGRLFYVDHFIAPDLMVARDLYKNITTPGSIAAENFAQGAAQMYTLRIPEKWSGKDKSISSFDFGEHLLIGLIRRNEGDQVIFPHGNDTLMPGDEVTFIGEAQATEKLPGIFGIETRTVKSVVIAGSSMTTVHLSTILHEHGIDVTIIDPDEEACKRLAEELSYATILHHTPTDVDFLIAEKINQIDVFVAASHSTDRNILAATIAQEAKCPEVVTVVSDTSYSHLLRRLGIHYSVSDKLCVSNRIVPIVHTEAMTSMTSLYDNRAKIVELKVSQETKVSGMPISELAPLLPHNCLIALIENRGEISIAKGNSVIAPGNTVIVITAPEHVTELQKLF
ncbi:MAG: Trk system potassium transporter TrkA [Chlamydiia bacterium]|nr:Trk system potassium transporter TrkA [Chlamydiia bacterium]MCP5509390.1 Trk system potassium transporter TrkA [Chlamydiales bacterium]